MNINLDKIRSKIILCKVNHLHS